MRYFITNPKDGADISVGTIDLKCGETKEFKKSDATYLTETFGFVELKTEKGDEFKEEKKREVKKEKKPAKK